jgi:hypothetical protein
MYAQLCAMVGGGVPCLQLVLLRAYDSNSPAGNTDNGVFLC